MILQMGLNKTGTTSLAQALEILGYNVCDTCPGLKQLIEDNIQKGRDPLEGIEEYDYDAITDNKALWENFEEIHRWNPDVRFIYTPRNTEDWLDSRQAHAAAMGRSFNRASHKELKKEHDRRAEQFASRSDVECLVVSICDDKGNWEDLCEFLDEPIPNKPFPHKNET